MAVGLGNLGNIVEDFTSALNEIFGGAAGVAGNKGEVSIGGVPLFDARVGGSVQLDRAKWTGNAKGRKVRYGFAVLTLDQVRNNTPNQTEVYYLDIPPQSIIQKEIFANNISATRKGIIVETEGVVFKDILIQGTTGVFPGERGGSNTPQSNLFTDPFSPPTPPQGVDPATGTSRKSGVATISGYEEFLRLRQFFLRYAQQKVETDGDRFLIFINEKDNQSLIVEPMEFTMERDKRSPMTYNYRINMKAIGDLNALFQGLDDDEGSPGGIIGFLEDVGNLSANVSATIQQGRAVINQSTRLIQRLTQAADQTINQPLQQIQFAMEDLRDGLATAIALPEILIRNTNAAVLGIRENFEEIQTLVAAGPPKPKPGEASTSQSQSEINQEFQITRDTVERIQTDNKVPLPRSFFQNARSSNQGLSDNLADFTGLGDPLYDSIKGRTSTIQPDPLKVVSDDEFLLLGALNRNNQALNLSIASNAAFESDAEQAFAQASAPFVNTDLPPNLNFGVTKPEFVKEITIQGGDTLERIAQREHGDPLRWVQIAVLNNLKPPYIAPVAGDNVKTFGDKILVSTA